MDFCVQGKKPLSIVGSEGTCKIKQSMLSFSFPFCFVGFLKIFFYAGTYRRVFGVSMKNFLGKDIHIPVL